MKKKLSLPLLLSVLVMILVNVTNTPVKAGDAPRKSLTIANSIYTGWAPHYWLRDSGVYQKWGDKYNTNVSLQHFSYDAALAAFAAGKVDAVTATNMDCLAAFCSAGVDCTVLVIGDYSNGNDGILTRLNVEDVKGLRGQTFHLLQLSVSHYLLARALDMNSMKEKDIKLMDADPDKLQAAFLADEGQKVVVTWNPMVMNLAASRGIKKVFDSSKIPGEILDLLVIRTDTLKKNPEFGELLVGAWYEAMTLFTSRGPEQKDMVEKMAASQESKVSEFNAMVTTTAFYYTPSSAMEAARSAEFKERTDFVRKFAFDKGLYGNDADNVDYIGIEYPDGSVVGNKDRIKLRFNMAYTQMAVEGKLKR
jgi:NitT/TauT family transport system substrate-binding protein